MVKPKILIIGGGIGGLSCATALAETGGFDISIYECDIIGGQASTKKSKLCNTEISWRVFGVSYKNLIKIIKNIGAMDNFYHSMDGDNCYDNGKIFSLKIIESLNHLCQKNREKLLKLLLMCKERSLNEYHNITTDEYFEKNNFIRLIVGPYMGLEPKKVTLSATLKMLFSGSEYGDYNNTMPFLTKYPTNDSLFDPWRNYLEAKGVSIYENHKMNNIVTDYNGNINEIIINNKIYKGDEIVFACSIKPLVKIFNDNSYFINTSVNKKLNILKTGQQFYISVNFYWKKEIIKNRKCHSYTFIDGWMPIILKRFINTDYIDKNCNHNIKEVWNISLSDYIVGNYIKKYTSQCSFKEIIYEIKMNILNSEHFKNYFDFENYTWGDYFFDYEFDDRYYKELPSTEKFSINESIEENLLNNEEPELGDNIYFSAYYVKNSVGGASMETSCEIGLTTADIICKKYNIKNPRKPIYKTRDYIYLFTYPLILLDCILYKLNFNPLTDYINPIVLLLMYIVIIIYIIIYLIKINI